MNDGVRSQTVPMIRVELDWMRDQMQHALVSSFGDEWRELVEKAVAKAFNDFDIDREAYRQAVLVLTGLVKDEARHRVADEIARYVATKLAPVGEI